MMYCTQSCQLSHFRSELLGSALFLVAALVVLSAWLWRSRRRPEVLHGETN